MCTGKGGGGGGSLGAFEFADKDCGRVVACPFEASAIEVAGLEVSLNSGGEVVGEAADCGPSLGGDGDEAGARGQVQLLLAD